MDKNRRKSSLHFLQKLFCTEQVARQIQAQTLQQYGLIFTRAAYAAAADFHTVETQMLNRFGDTPCQVVLSKVCCPGWLVEVEGIALIPQSNPNLPEF